MPIAAVGKLGKLALLPSKPLRDANGDYTQTIGIPNPVVLGLNPPTTPVESVGSAGIPVSAARIYKTQYRLAEARAPRRARSPTRSRSPPSTGSSRARSPPTAA